MADSDPFRLHRTTLRSGWDRSSFFAHARPGLIPAPHVSEVAASSNGIGVVLMQRVSFDGSDVFGEYHQMITTDGGAAWTGPSPCAALGPRTDEKGRVYLASGLTPAWHEATKTLLAVGNTVRYVDGAVMPGVRPMETAYSVFDPERRVWSAWATVEMPGGDRYRNAGSSGGQRVDLSDGEILQPIHFRPPETHRPGDASSDPWNQSWVGEGPVAEPK